MWVNDCTGLISEWAPFRQARRSGVRGLTLDMLFLGFFGVMAEGGFDQSFLKLGLALLCCNISDKLIKSAFHVKY